MAAWSFSVLFRVSYPTLFQVILVVAHLATVLGNCGPPPTLSFAFPINVLNQTHFRSGTTLKYSCRPGYIATSSNQNIQCTTEGKWKQNILCIKKRCSYPQLTNGLVKINTDISFGSEIEFTCLEGYILIGSSTSRCEITDKGVDWSDPFPECEIAKCRPPPGIHNGKHSGGKEDFFTYGSSVTYSCDTDFSLLGNASLSCIVVNKTMGVWSPSPPTCKNIICSRPNVPHGLVVSGFVPIYKYKDSITFTCQTGTILRGSSTIYCEADSSWSPPPPICELNGCTDIPDIPHASWETYSRPRKGMVYQPGTVLSYRCHTGYEPIAKGPMTVTCQSDFRWSQFEGCKVVCCPVPELGVRITRRRRTYSDKICTYYYGDVVSYTCHNNQKSASCKLDGTWDPKTPSCDNDQDCSIPPIIAHGFYTRVNSFLGLKEEVTYHCEEGYRLVGQAKLSCSYSQWSPGVPQCKALCLKPEIRNGKISVDKDQYIEAENVTIICDSGFAIQGPQNITCSGNRTWYPKLPMCEWAAPEGCEHVVAGWKLMQCLPSPEDVKMALEVYKLSMEIEQLERQRDRAHQSNYRGISGRQSLPETSL